MKKISSYIIACATLLIYSSAYAQDDSVRGVLCADLQEELQQKGRLKFQSALGIPYEAYVACPNNGLWQADPVIQSTLDTDSCEVGFMCYPRKAS